MYAIDHKQGDVFLPSFYPTLQAQRRDQRRYMRHCAMRPYMSGLYHSYMLSMDGKRYNKT